MKFTRIAMALAAIAALGLMISGPGARFGLWEFGTGFMMMRWALYLGLAAAALALVFLVIPKTRRGQGVHLGAAMVIGLGVAWVPWSIYQTAQDVPPIHDITTDIGNPPEFVVIAPLRADAPNPVEYAGAETAAQQREAYPDIQPLETELPSAELFERALEAAQARRGWEIVANEPADGRIEAVVTTFWYGFIDDVVIRVSPTATGSRLDMRSKSRLGRSDLGANAARIRAYMERLEAAIH